MGILINRNNYIYEIDIHTKHGSYTYYCDDYYYDNANSTLTLYDAGVGMNHECRSVIGEFTEVTDYYAKQVR